LIVTGRSTTLETSTFLGDFLGPTVDDEIRAWKLTPHSGAWSPRTFRLGSVNPLLGVWVRTSWILLPASPSSDPRRLHTLFSPFDHSPFQPPSHSSTYLTTNQDESPKTSPLICTGSSLLRFRPSRFGFLSFLAENQLAASRAHGDRIIENNFFKCNNHIIIAIYAPRALQR
jgi:hypothetical protein